MADSLTFTFAVDDKTSGPLAKMISLMDKFQHETRDAGHEAKESFKGIGETLEGISSKLTHASEFFGLTALMEGLGKVGELAEAVFDKFKEFGAEVLRTSDYSRTTKISLEALIGTAEGAEKVFAGAKAFAIEAGTPLKATVDAYRELTLAGVQAQNLPKILQAASDLSILKTGSLDAMGTFADMLGKIQSKGVATSLEFRQLKGLLDFKTLAKNLGVSSMEDLKGESIKAEKAIGGILTTLQQMEHGTLGNVTKQVGEGFAGSVNKMKTQWDLLLESFESTGAFDVLLDFLRELTKQLGPGGELGPVLRDTFTDLFKSIGEGLKEITKPGVLKEFIADLKTIATSLGEITKDIGALAHLGGMFGGALLSPDKKTRDLGQQATMGLAQGMLEKAMNPLETWSEILDTMVSGGQKRLDSHSPSRVMMRLGEDVVDGFELGLGPEDRMSESLNVRLPERAPGGGARGASLSLHQEFHISAEQGMDVDELAHRIAQVSVGDLTSAFETLGVSTGAYGGS